MTPQARSRRIREVRQKLRAWRPERYSSPRIAKAVRTRWLHRLRRLLREQANVAKGRPPGWRRPLP